MKNNFKYGNDQSIACWLTDYIMSFVLLYFSIISYKKYIKENKDKQKKNIYLNLFLFNLLVCLSSFFGATTHLFFYKDKTLINDIFWRITMGFNIVSCIIFFNLITLLTFNKINIKLNNIILIILCLIFFLLKMITGSYSFDYFCIITYCIIPIYSIGYILSKNFKKNKIKNNIKFIFSMVIFLIYTLTYIINLHPNCNKQNRTNCILPNWFNHNALLHVLYSISYILLNLHIIEIE